MNIKTITKLLCIGMAVAFCCSPARAQFSYSNSLAGATLIYSNSFTGSGTVNITNTTPDFSTNLLGGTSNAAWLDAGGSGDTGALFANGSVTSTQGDTWLLPFTPQSGYVYTLSVTVNITANPGSWITAGYAQNYAIPGIANSAPNGSGVNSYAWTLRNWSGNTEYFAGPGANHNVYNSTPPSSSSYHTYTQILDTTAPQWVTTAFFDGVALGSPYNYGATVPVHALGVGQHALSNPAGYQWTSLTLSAAPIVIGRQPVSANVDAGSVFTNSVAVVATSPAYQWYNNGVAITGATNASLVFNPVSTGDGGTDYYVVITNSLGSITSSVASLTVFTNPVFSTEYPVAYTNPITLYGGGNVGGTNYFGSSPTFSVSVLAGVPFTYQWLTNGVPVDGATNAAFTFTNCQLTGPTSFACVVSNSYGLSTNAWGVSYLQTPMAAFPNTVLSYDPIGFWRLNEGPDDFNGDNGVLAFDYAGGNNGVYTNAVLAYPAYIGTDPTASSVRFNYAGVPSDVFGIQGIDFSGKTNATFSVQAWVNGSSAQPNGAGIISKGYNGGDQFALSVTGNKYQFVVRNAAGTASTVTSTTGPDNNWHFLVGVCDEVNGTVSLYLDGLLAGSASITKGSGVLSTARSVMIGARGSSATANDDLQFDGYLSDLAAYNYALTAGQIAQAYPYPIPISFVAPLPPTNVVFLANGTLTVPATAFSALNAGYYWTNLTTGAIMGTGTTNGLVNLNAGLILSNAPASLSGDQLELVITNANSSTNWFVTLFSPAPPIQLDYSNSILYSNYFNGGTWSIAGMPLTAANTLVGGTNTPWVDALGTNDTAGVMQGNGIATTTQPDSWVLPFTPHAGYVYTISASLTFSGNPGSWVGLGFAQNVPTNAAIGYGRFSDGGATPPQQGPNGYDWLIMQSSGSVQYFAGPGGNPPAGLTNGTLIAAAPVTHTVQIYLDTTGAQWVQYAFIDGISMGTNTYASNPPIGAVGITHNSLSSPQNIQWNYFALTQVAPGGVPPYLLNPLPPTNSIVLTNTTVTISATAFGSAPLGYYWSNNSTNIASGLTNNMAPLPAGLSVATSTLSPGQLALVVTNAYGTNITLITLVSPENPYPPVMGFSVIGNQLTLSWPTNAGWTLQAQTNSLNTGLGTNWVDVPGSTTITQFAIPMNPTNGGVFYRMRY